MWHKNCKEEEEKSQKLWERKEKWFKNLPQMEETTASSTDETETNQRDKQTMKGDRYQDRTVRSQPSYPDRFRHTRREYDPRNRSRSPCPSKPFQGRPNFRTFNARGPQTNHTARVMQNSNTRFQQIQEDKSSRPNRRFLFDNGSIQVTT